MQDKIARSQGSQSFTAYTISKDENDLFYETLIHSIGPTRKFSKKKSVSIDSKCSETHRNAKKSFYPFDRLRASPVAQSPSSVAQ